MLYFDGFAGCGELTKGYPGSPIVAIRTAVQGAPALNAPLDVKMVEEDAERYQHLRKVLHREGTDLAPLSNQIRVDDPVFGKCEDEATKLLDEYDQNRRRLGPAFFFLDQYGYSSFSMDLVRRILAHEKCETFAYLNWQRMHPYLTDPTKVNALNRAMGGEEWREVQPLRGQERADRFKSIYIRLLRERAGAKYVYYFGMRGRDHRLIYWLFFATNSIKGLAVMKKAMWKVDPTGLFEFSDRDADQGKLLGYTQPMLADELDRALRGRELTSDELSEYVLTQTPEYRFKEAITILKKNGSVKELRQGGKVIYKFIAPPMTPPSLFPVL